MKIKRNSAGIRSKGGIQERIIIPIPRANTKINRYKNKHNNINLTKNISFNIFNKQLYFKNERIELTKNEKNILYLLLNFRT